MGKVSWTMIGLAALLYALALPRFPIGHFQDDARDILAAQALTHGHYVDLQDPVKRPLNFPLPGFPLLLTPFVIFFRHAWGWLRLLPWGLSLLALILIERLSRIWLSSSQRHWALALVAFNPLFVFLSSCVISDMLFLVLVVADFLVLEKYFRNPSSRVLGGLGFLTAGACLVRPEGILLLLTYALVFWAYCDVKAHFPLLAPSLIALCLWIGRNEYMTHALSGYSILWEQNWVTLVHDPVYWIYQVGREVRILLLDVLGAIDTSSGVYSLFHYGIFIITSFLTGSGLYWFFHRRLHNSAVALASSIFGLL